MRRIFERKKLHDVVPENANCKPCVCVVPFLGLSFHCMCDCTYLLDLRFGKVILTDGVKLNPVNDLGIL